MAFQSLCSFSTRLSCRMIILVLTLMDTLHFHGVYSETVCRDEYSMHGTTCYRVDSTPKTWQDALKTCNAEGTSLLTIHNSEENEFFVGQSVAAGMNLWIGLNDINNEGVFQWADGSPVNYTNWDYPTQPDDAYNNEDCAHLYGFLNLGWNDNDCGATSIGFICAEGPGQPLCPSAIPVSERVDCHPEPNATEEACTSRTCCWEGLSEPGPWCSYSRPGQPLCPSAIPVSERVDCHPEPNATEEACTSRTCCWEGLSEPGPWCSYSRRTHGYSTSTAAGSSPETLPTTSLNENEAYTVPTSTKTLDQLKRELKQLVNITVSFDNVATVAEELVIVVAGDDELDKEDLDDINHVLTNIVTLNDTTVQVTTSIVELVDNILDSYEENSTDSNSDGPVPEAPNQIQRALERLVSVLQSRPGNTTIEGERIAIQAVKVPVASASKKGLTFEAITTGERILGPNNTKITTGQKPSPLTEAAITFQVPREILGEDDDMLPVSFMVYQNALLFPSTILAEESMKKEGYRRAVASLVISATVEGVSAIKLPKTNPVKLYFEIVQVSDEEWIDNIKCVFWDTTLSNGLGDWSDEDCITLSVEGGRVKCHCYHLTNFAVLMDIYGVKHNILDVFSKVGCSVSICCLLLTILTYISSRDLRSRQPLQILLCFCCSLLSLYVVFLFGIEQTSPQIGCIIVAMLLHYLTMTTLLWMIVEAVKMYIDFVKVNGVHIRRFLLKASIVAWGSPAAIVMIIGLADVGQYRNRMHCFIRIGAAFYLTHVLLLGLTIVVNSYIFAHVMYSLTCDRVESSATINASKASEMKQRVRRAISITSLLGLTWVFGLFALIHEDTTLVFQILFCVFNSLQGLFIFVMFCVLNDRVRSIWRVWLYHCRCSGDQKQPQGLRMTVSDTTD